MQMIIGAIAFTLAVPAIAQTAPATNPHAGHSVSQAPQDGPHGKHSMADMHKSCRDMMKHHERKGSKTEAERMDADVNGNGHQGHNH